MIAAFHRDIPASSATIAFGDGPDGTAQRFVPGIVSTDHLEHSAPAVSPDGGVMFWSIARRPDEGLPRVILFARRAEEGWAQPVIAPFSGMFNDDGPAFSPDGGRLYFASNRPLFDGQDRTRISDIWFVERQNESWSQPQCTGLASRFSAPTSLTMPSVTRGGTIYFVAFTRNGSGRFEICRARLADADDTLPEQLGNSINHPGALNWTPWIAPDESFLLFSSNRPGSNDAGGDIYVARRQPDGSWETPILLDDSVNTPAQERFPAVSPDGRFLFFTRWTREHDHDVFVAETERLAAFNPGLITR